MRYQRLILGGVTLFLALTLVRPLYPREQFLQHSPTVIVIPLLFWAASRGWFGNGSMTCIAAFLCLHILGARYLYSLVPYDAWSVKWFGINLTESLGFTRNHYDRLVHLAFGVLGVPPIAEAARRHGGLSDRWAAYLAVVMIMAVSCAYEIFEWGLTMTLAPDQAEAYNGQQGDYWDSQTDMALAALGRILYGLGLWWAAGREND